MYFSVPVSSVDKVCFNAHRIFKPSTVIKEFTQMKLKVFAYIHEYKIYETENPTPEKISEIEKDLGEFDCGIFIFEKFV